MIICRFRNEFEEAWANCRTWIGPNWRQREVGFLHMGTWSLPDPWSLCTIV